MMKSENQENAENASKVPYGSHVTGRDINGWKYFRNCRVQTWSDWLTGRYREYDHCRAKVTVREGGTIVRPEWINEYDEQVFSDNLRTNKLEIGDIETQDGHKCLSAKTGLILYDATFGRYFESSITEDWFPNKEYESKLDTNYWLNKAYGIQFSPYKVDGGSSFTKYYKDGKVIRA